MPTGAEREAWHQARTRLTTRFANIAQETAWNPQRCLPPVAAVAAVADAIEFGQPVDADDVRAGLCLLPVARQDLIASELDLIRQGRATGLTWEEIGTLLGIGDRRAARQRYARLSARRGGIPEASDQQETEQPR